MNFVSSSPKIHQALRVSGLDEFFGDKVFSAYTVGSWKPDPGLFLHAAEVMGYEPARCAVIEDSPTGIAAATAAGMHALLFTPSKTEAFGPEHVIRFKEMGDLPTLLAGL